MRKKPSRRGFTLRELLAVITIICFVLALTVPAIHISREAARRNECSNNLKNVGMGLQNYHDTYKGVATQMGNQGTASRELRLGVDVIRAGLLGTIQEVHAYTGGGSGDWPLPDGSQPVPDHLDWDLWLGPAAERPYHVEWMRWHQWRDFATGNLGNWASHSANLAFMALRIHELWHPQPG